MCYHQEMQKSSYRLEKPPRWKLLWPVVRELGFRQVGLFALYRFGLLSGHYRRLCDPERAARQAGSLDLNSIRPLWQLPAQDDLQSVLGEPGRAALLREADEIVAGRVRLFGGPAVDLRLALPSPLADWTAYVRSGTSAGGGPEADIKWTWEPGRLGWAYSLGRAYLLSRDERYAAAFWSYIEAFLDANPPYQGPHWASAQEVALRLIALTFCWQVFGGADSADPQRPARLAQAVAVHAGRIPSTLVYARAQNNNHLLSEAAGLYTAGLFLPDHPDATRWRSLGWRWLNQGLQEQIDSDGAYVQHSTNYHRLMLQIGLWVSFLAGNQGQALPGVTLDRLAAATRWLLALLDPESGRVPNLGPNDGAYILPLTVCPYSDFRPVLQAAAGAFLGEQTFVKGPWDEMALWLTGRQPAISKPVSSTSRPGQSAYMPHVLRSPDGASWAYLRAANFSSRPGHADQLHLDFWWRGLNVAQDAGTYLYNAGPPWDNALAHSQVHNTVVVDGQDQMRRAGRFLYVDWAQAEVLPSPEAAGDARERLSARHNGYRRLGLWHQREVSVTVAGDWEIVDTIYPMQTPGPGTPFSACLHWLLPDWPWEARLDQASQAVEIQLASPFGPILLYMEQDQAVNDLHPAPLQIPRAGELLYGKGPVLPTWGWASPTYGMKVPALSARFTADGSLPIRYLTKIALPAGA